EHFPGFNARGAVAGEQQVFLHPYAVFGAASLGGQQAEDAVGVAQGGHFRVDHHDRLVGEVHSQERALLDARGRVEYDVVEAVVGQFLEHLLDALGGQRVLVAGLRRGQHEQVVVALVLDQGLAQGRLALDHVDEVVHHAPLATHDQVEVAQAHVEVDRGDLLAMAGEAAGKGGAGGGLAHAALAGSDYDDFGQNTSPSVVVPSARAQSSAAILSSSLSSQTCTALPRSSFGMSSSTL